MLAALSNATVFTQAATLLLKEFMRVQSSLDLGLRAQVERQGRGSRDVQQQEVRMGDLCDSVVQLYEDLGC